MKPEWAEIVADSLLASMPYQARNYRGALIRALLKAEQRGRREGMEEAAKVAGFFHGDDDRMDRQVKSDVAAAIRSKMEVQP